MAAFNPSLATSIQNSAPLKSKIFIEIAKSCEQANPEPRQCARTEIKMRESHQLHRPLYAGVFRSKCFQSLVESALAWCSAWLPEQRASAGLHPPTSHLLFCASATYEGMGYTSILPWFCVGWERFYRCSRGEYERYHPRIFFCISAPARIL